MKTDAQLKCEQFSEAIDKIIAKQWTTPGEKDLLKRTEAEVQRLGDLPYNFLTKVVCVPRDRDALADALKACERFRYQGANYLAGHAFVEDDNDEGELDDVDEVGSEDSGDGSSDEDDGEGKPSAKRPRADEPFAGQGRTLRESQAAPSEAAMPVAAVAPLAAIVDESLPVTTVQVCLKDGSKLRVRLNHVHTVGALRAHVATLVPLGERFELTYLRSKIGACDDDKTVADADLLSASIVVA
ncbi:hypothetical protein T492DRAFT_919740 [Pavlovales sp. CCMP2436]|nr:hypothetical protein T492DRAFT_919740 [Pavlovales sp. CCMP2436]